MSDFISGFTDEGKIVLGTFDADTGIFHMGSTPDEVPDMVNHPPHYTRGPLVTLRDGPGGISGVIECIQVIRWIRDMRLANAMRYVWRVAFGGKENDRQDIQKAIWYLQDWLDNEVDVT